MEDVLLQVGQDRPYLLVFLILGFITYIHNCNVYFHPLQIADDFIEHTVSQACALAKHRKANNIDVRDVQVLEGPKMS